MSKLTKEEATIKLARLFGAALTNIDDKAATEAADIAYESVKEAFPRDYKQMEAAALNAALRAGRVGGQS